MAPRSMPGPIAMRKEQGMIIPEGILKLKALLLLYLNYLAYGVLNIFKPRSQNITVRPKTSFRPNKKYLCLG